MALSCTQKTMSLFPLDCSIWTLHHRRMLKSLGKVLVNSLEEKCSCGVSELYLQGWCPALLTQFAVPSSPIHSCLSSGTALLKPNLQACIQVRGTGGPVVGTRDFSEESQREPDTGHLLEERQARGTVRNGSL